MRVVGFDLSLTATGVADEGGECLIESGEGDLGERLSRISDEFDGALSCTDLAMVEDLPRNARFGGVALGMVHACFRLAVVRSEFVLMPTPLPLRVMYVPPATLKLYATGKGNAGKPEMLTEAVRRLGYEGHDDNEADAMWLRALGLDVIGEPPVAMPAKNRTALDKLTIPAGFTRK